MKHGHVEERGFAAFNCCKTRGEMESAVSYLDCKHKGKPGLYLLYSGALYVSQDDESVSVLHHVGGKPTLTFVPRMKSFSRLAVCPDSLRPPLLLPSLE